MTMGGTDGVVKNAKADAEAADRLMSLAHLVEEKSSNKSTNDLSKTLESQVLSSRTHETPEHELPSHGPAGSSHGDMKTPNPSKQELDDCKTESANSSQASPMQGPVSMTVGGDEGRPDSPSSTMEGSMDGKDSTQRSYFVKHDYRDHAHVRIEELSPVETSIPASQRSNRGGVKMLFPEKLHQLLSMSPQIVDPAVISWAPHGRCFSVHNTREFTRELMPKYFNHNAITSFQRQLNLYGFKRITKAGSKDQGAYYHELFLRGRPGLCRRMRRQKIKGTGYKPLPDPDNEPNFYEMEPCYEVLDENEKKEQELLHRSFDRATSSPTQEGLPTKRTAELSENDVIPDHNKMIRRDLEHDQAAFVARADLLTRAAADEVTINNARRLSLLGAMQTNPRRISLPERANYNLQSHITGVTGVSGTLGPGEYRRGSLPLSSGRDVNGRFADPLGRLLPDRHSSPGRDGIIQELIARARGGNDIPGLPLGRGSIPNDTAIRNEIDMLEQTRRNIVIQQQRLQMLMDQAHATKRSSLGLGGDYSAPGMGAWGLVGGAAEMERRASLTGRGIGEFERRASLLAAQRFVEPRASIGGLEAALGAAGSRRASIGSMGGMPNVGAPQMPKAQPENHSIDTDARDMSSSAVYNTLANMVSSGRFTNAQLDELELMLQSGRNKAASAKKVGSGS